MFQVTMRMTSDRPRLGVWQGPRRLARATACKTVRNGAALPA
jgi:hypothetical protein